MMNDRPPPPPPPLPFFFSVGPQCIDRVARPHRRHTTVPTTVDGRTMDLLFSLFCTAIFFSFFFFLSFFWWLMTAKKADDWCVSTRSMTRTGTIRKRKKERKKNLLPVIDHWFSLHLLLLLLLHFVCVCVCLCLSLVSLIRLVESISLSRHHRVNERESLMDRWKLYSEAAERASERASEVLHTHRFSSLSLSSESCDQDVSCYCVRLLVSLIVKLYARYIRRTNVGGGTVLRRLRCCTQAIKVASILFLLLLFLFLHPLSILLQQQQQRRSSKRKKEGPRLLMSS